MDLVWHGAEIEAELARRAEAASREAGEALLAAAELLVPEDQSDPGHALAASGTVTTEGTTTTVSFGTQYAVLQHERMDYAHSPGRQAKFLEQPMVSERADLLAIIARVMRV